MYITNKQISVAPMMDCTDRHDRYFLRLIAPDVLLYTEMITAQALHHGDVNYLLGYDQAEHPLALQVGGSDPVLLAQAARYGEEFGYDEINLNVGCPSSRVSAGRFGACLMKEPSLVADCVTAMRAAVSVPVTVKCRIGVDEQDTYEQLHQFITLVAKTDCNTFIIHARKAWLSGLSPKENRDIPPLRYDMVHQLKRDFPHLSFILNGGIKTLADIDRELPSVDGIMVGRSAYSNPYLLSDIQERYFPKRELLTREEVIQAYIPYVIEQMKNGVKLTGITRHLVGLYWGQPGANHWRRYLSEHAFKLSDATQLFNQALIAVGQAQHQASSI